MLVMRNAEDEAEEPGLVELSLVEDVDEDEDPPTPVFL